MKRIAYLLVFVLLFVLAGCDNAKKVEEGVFWSGTDDADRQVTIAKQPERVVVLSTSLLELCAELKPEVIVGRPDTKVGKIPESVAKADTVGMVYNINLEKVASLQPDLVIAGEGMHEKFVSALDGNQIPALILRMKTYDDIKKQTMMLGQVLGVEERAKTIAEGMDKEMAAIPKPSKKIRAIILHSTSKSVTVELDTSIAGSAAKFLGIENLASGSQPLDKDADQTPYSLEKIVELNPDVVFVVTMGKVDELKEKMDKEMASNPAWSSVNAIKNKKVYYLPQELFLLNPGVHYPEAVAYLAHVAEEASK